MFVFRTVLGSKELERFLFLTRCVVQPSLEKLFVLPYDGDGLEITMIVLCDRFVYTSSVYSTVIFAGVLCIFCVQFGDDGIFISRTKVVRRREHLR